MALVLALLLCSFGFFATASSDDTNKVSPAGRYCTFPELLNGEYHAEDHVYQSTINYTCDEGYTLHGSSSAVCQANGTWSSIPTCIVVTCSLPPIPQYGMVIYSRAIRSNTTKFLDVVRYKCLPPFALIGNPVAECTATGSWSHTPKCQVVKCPPPGNIEHGHMFPLENRTFSYMEKVRFGCIGNYVREGSLDIFCQRNGKWSQKPSCMAPCKVDIPRGQIIFQGQKIHIEEQRPKMIYHSDKISVYCKHEERNCSYALPSQCINGTLKYPECFEEPSPIDSTLLPSEMTEC